MPGGAAFVEGLRAMIDAGRAFGRHPLWRRIAEGRLPRSALRPFAVQFFLQVREFPRAVSALHSSCPDTRERVELAESLYEEETGRISGCNVSHPELFVRFGEGVGVTRDAMVNGVPLPATAALIDWFERSTRQHPFIEGAAATNLAAEGRPGPVRLDVTRHVDAEAVRTHHAAEDRLLAEHDVRTRKLHVGPLRHHADHDHRAALARHAHRLADRRRRADRLEGVI